MEYENRVVVRVFLLLLPFFLIVFRLMTVLPATNPPNINHDKALTLVPDWIRGSNIMVFLGSGGHTGEMIKLLSNIDVSELSRTWIMSSGDTTSILKCKDFENNLTSDFSANFLTLHRARSVGEPLVSSIKNTILSFIDSMKQLIYLPEYPAVLLLNGPGTSVPIAYIIFGLKFCGVCRTKIIYVESLARVEDLSVSGKLILPIADRLIVQWAPVANKYKRAEYYGILI